WGYGRDYHRDSAQEAFLASVAAGVSFVDTAEIYGFGQSERLIRDFLKLVRTPVVIATKFMPFPWRLDSGALQRALKGSLTRLGLTAVDLYQIHWPIPVRPMEVWLNAMADAYHEGMINAVGVSNFSAEQTKRAHETLARRGVPLASNQIHYNLLTRAPERNGLLATCRDLGVTVIAYSPIGKGLLTGKYTPDHLPPGVRSLGARQNLIRIQPLIDAMRQIADARGKTVAQVALNWCIVKGTVPIPGAKNAAQAEQNAGALGWRLTDDEVATLDRLSDSIGTIRGA
ncbi:MAG: aldo/keto reductase, partial [Dehalococcoidia bacterium]|nr:aldo/keto reductase [Dehalococcoidia bacterium]